MSQAPQRTEQSGQDTHTTVPDQGRGYQARGIQSGPAGTAIQPSTSNSERPTPLRDVQIPAAGFPPNGRNVPSEHSSRRRRVLVFRRSRKPPEQSSSAPEAVRPQTSRSSQHSGTFRRRPPPTVAQERDHALPRNHRRGTFQQAFQRSSARPSRVHREGIHRMPRSSQSLRHGQGFGFAVPGRFPARGRSHALPRTRPHRRTLRQTTPINISVPATPRQGIHEMPFASAQPLENAQAAEAALPSSPFKRLLPPWSMQDIPPEILPQPGSSQSFDIPASEQPVDYNQLFQPSPIPQAAIPVAEPQVSSEVFGSMPSTFGAITATPPTSTMGMASTSQLSTATWEFQPVPDIGQQMNESAVFELQFTAPLAVLPRGLFVHNSTAEQSHYVTTEDLPSVTM